MYKLLSEQHEGAIKDLRSELDAAQKEHADLVEQVKVFKVGNEDFAMSTNDQTLQGKIDRLALENEAALEQLASVEVHIQVAKEKAKERARQNEDLQAQLGSTITERDALGKELEIMRSELKTTRADAEEMVAQYTADVEASDARLKVTVEYVKRLSRREIVEEIHAWGFDLVAEIEEVNRLEVEAKKMDEPEDEEGFEGSDESEDGEDPNGSSDEAGSGEDQA
ncbi:uncharacterized protein [Nicotiana sylvestris]|uniref:uncharacterized protein n=1 Tax=Nicotiana sylvestris TaxID=4096 RepID=UPI00388C6961